MRLQQLTRTFSLSTLVVVLLSGCTATRAPFQDKDIPESDDFSILTMRASEMSCVGCVWAISTAIEGVSGVIAVDGDIDTKQIYIIYDRTLVSSETLVDHPIFDNYGREFLSDEAYSP